MQAETNMKGSTKKYCAELSDWPRLTVSVGSEQIEAIYGGHILERLPRLYGKGGHPVYSRYIFEWLKCNREPSTGTSTMPRCFLSARFVLGITGVCSDPALISGPFKVGANNVPCSLKRIDKFRATLRF